MINLHRLEIINCTHPTHPVSKWADLSPCQNCSLETDDGSLVNFLLLNNLPVASQVTERCIPGERYTSELLVLL
jgi:hypothetical protein